MEMDRVTLTGADDSVSPRELLKISREFPFVEWGILVSRSCSFDGRSRFPSVKWVEELADAVEDARVGTCFGPKYQFSCHVCGQWVKDLFPGSSLDRSAIQKEWPWLLPIYFDPDDPGLFQRVQLNFHALKHGVPINPCRLTNVVGTRQVIFQIDGVNDYLFEWAINAGINAVPLYDMSGGAGIVPEEWPMETDAFPKTVATSVRPNYHGYAGGLGPDNLGAELERIFKAAGNRRIWIDMETLIRSDDDSTFDLDKCRKVLEFARGKIK
jgi:hypothetical protein